MELVSHPLRIELCLPLRRQRRLRQAIARSLHSASGSGLVPDPMHRRGLSNSAVSRTGHKRDARDPSQVLSRAAWPSLRAEYERMLSACARCSTGDLRQHRGFGFAGAAHILSCAAAIGPHEDVILANVLLRVRWGSTIRLSRRRSSGSGVTLAIIPALMRRA
jgi:hypothetical protein